MLRKQLDGLIGGERTQSKNLLQAPRRAGGHEQPGLRRFRRQSRQYLYPLGTEPLHAVEDDQWSILAP